MARYIDANKLEELCDIMADKCDGMGVSIWNQFKTMVEMSPTVDAMPVVRCKDCKNRERIDEYRYCCKAEVIVYDMSRGPNNGEWYCADGERKDDD